MFVTFQTHPPRVALHDSKTDIRIRPRHRADQPKALQTEHPPGTQNKQPLAGHRPALRPLLAGLRPLLAALRLPLSVGQHALHRNTDNMYNLTRHRDGDTYQLLPETARDAAGCWWLTVRILEPRTPVIVHPRLLILLLRHCTRPSSRPITKPTHQQSTCNVHGIPWHPCTVLFQG